MKNTLPINPDETPSPPPIDDPQIPDRYEPTPDNSPEPEPVNTPEPLTDGDEHLSSHRFSNEKIKDLSCNS